MMEGAAGFSFNDLLAGLLNIDPAFQQTTPQYKSTSIQSFSVRCAR